MRVAGRVAVITALALGPIAALFGVGACNAIAGFGDFVRVDASSSDSKPTTVDGGSPKAEFFLGAKHSCAIMEDHTVRCWGRNDFGQLGVGGTETKKVPTPVPNLTDVVYVSLGERHTCAVLSTDGSVWCWGTNENAQLGIGPADSSPHDTPTRVEASPAKKVQAGKGHTCIETQTKTMECWGANQSGQLGDGSTAQKSVPTRVPSITGVAKASIGGGDHTCAVAQNADVGGSSVYCWGLNDKGQLGQPLSIPSSPVPLVVPSVIDPDKVFVGSEHSCATLPDTTVVCWGANEQGQLGDGTQATRPTPSPVASVVGMTEVGAGFSHMCGVEKGNGVAKCWGSNEFGQLGIGTLGGNRPFPNALPDTGWESISSKGEHACGRRNGMSWCWGRNDSGQLGIGSLTDTATPTVVTF